MNRALALAAILALCACGGTPSSSNGGSLPPSSGMGTHAAAAKTPIAHVIIVIQENRSFDNLFATYGHGSDGATFGYTHKHHRVNLVKASLIEPDIGHGYKVFRTEQNGGAMDGFDLNTYGVTHQPVGTYLYQFVDPAQIVPYWTIAKQYVLGDRMFQTQGSDSFTAHQDLIAGGTAINATESIIDGPSRTPYGCDSPAGTVTNLITNAGVYETGKGPFPCLSYATLRDRLEPAGLTWKYYTPQFTQTTGGGIWNAFDAIRAVHNSQTEWKAHISVPQTNVLYDASHGKLPNVAWVVPDLPNSDHPGDAHDTGPSWVAQIVNAVGQGPQWKSTAIVVVWDDWGGFFDHVNPAKVASDGLGFRIPMLVVSPYAKKNYVDHTQYEFGSILRFVEDNWGLATVGASDARATPIDNAFDFTQTPRSFVPLAAKYSRSYFETQAPSGLPVDDE